MFADSLPTWTGVYHPQYERGTFWKPQAAGIRGEEVRMINIRACVSEMDDIFDGEGDDKRWPHA